MFKLSGKKILSYLLKKNNQKPVIKTQSDKKEWLVNLVNDAEEKFISSASVPFKITDIKSNGFQVKVNGLNAYIGFSSMPWYYSNFELWRSVFPIINGRVFFAKISRFSREPLGIFLDASSVEQFKKVDMSSGFKYECLIINKKDDGYIVDAGIDTHWKYGALKGFVSINHFYNQGDFENYNIGDTIILQYLYREEYDFLFFSHRDDIVHWESGEAQQKVGEFCKAELIEIDDNGTRVFRIDGIFRAVMLIKKSMYTPVYRKIVKNRIKQLTVGDVIDCEIISFEEDSYYFNLRWCIDIGFEDARTKPATLSNFISEDVAQRLNQMFENETEN